MPRSPVTFNSLTAPGRAAVWKYHRPFLLLQAIALLLVIGYYRSSEIHLWANSVSHLKQRVGLPFIAASAAFAGAVLPEIAKVIMLRDAAVTRQRFRDVTFALAVFAVNGVLSNLQYRGIAWIIGDDTRFITAVRKMLFDQFVTTPIYGVGYWVLVYSLRAHRYRLAATLREISPRWYVRQVMPLLISAWAFWIPMTLLIYSLPGDLQFLLYLFAVGAWSLLMVFVASGSGETA